jgi:hypothetical protein
MFHKACACALAHEGEFFFKVIHFVLPTRRLSHKKEGAKDAVIPMEAVSGRYGI